MKRSDELRQQRAEKVEALIAIQEKAEAENRFLSEEEQADFDLLRINIDALQKQIDDAEFAEEQQRKIAQTKADQRRNVTKDTPEGKLAKRFSIMRAIQGAFNGTTLEGAEAEAFQETQNEARSFGQQMEGQVGIPSFIVNPHLQRTDQNVGTAGDGGNLVFDEWQGHIAPLRPRPVVEAAGATVLRGLQGNAVFTKNSNVSATWEGEVDANAETLVTMSQLVLTPKRLGATSQISKQLILQSSPDVEQIITNEFRRAQENGLDAAAINGASGGDDPTGILNTAGVGVVAIGTNGGAATWAKMRELVTTVKAANGDLGTMAAIMTPELEGSLATIEKATNTGNFILNEMNERAFAGYRHFISTNVPNDLTKGSGTALNAIIFGAWSGLYLANWGGLDIVVDPYSAKKTAQVEITVNAWWDVGLRHAGHFAYCKDLTV